MAHTDTERLDWLLGHRGAQIDSDQKHCWIRWFRESYWYVVSLPGYDDLRALIDLAIDGKAEKQNF